VYGSTWLQICNSYSRLPTLKNYIVPYSPLGNKVVLPKKFTPQKNEKTRKMAV